MIVEGVITLIIVGALFYVAPGVLATVRSSAPVVYAATVPYGGSTGTQNASWIIDPALNASVGTIGTTAVGALNLSAVSVIMLGIGLMIGGFMLIRNPK